MKKIVLLLMGVSLVSCSTTKKNDVAYMEGVALWMQNSAEVRALRYQAFNAARYTVDQSLKKRSKKPRALIVDIDETVLDNSPYQARGLVTGEAYNEQEWERWVDMGKARALAGSVGFLNYAVKKGVEVFYISNRKVRGFEPTYQNLKEEGFPVKKQNLILKTHTSSKDERRKAVFKKYNVILLMGDTLADFHTNFEDKNTNERNILVDSFRKEFGKKFIVLPNPMYGDWEWALHDYDYSKSMKEREQERKKFLYPY